MKEILALFDEVGRKTSAVLEGLHYETPAGRQKYIDEGYIPITEEENNLYTPSYTGKNHTGYLRDPKTGNPIDAPPIEYSKTEKAEQIKNKYSVAFEDLKTAMVTAVLNDDIELQNDLKEEYADLMAEYKKELEELRNGKS